MSDTATTSQHRVSELEAHYVRCNMTDCLAPCGLRCPRRRFARIEAAVPISGGPGNYANVPKVVLLIPSADKRG